jgi:acetylornithine/succinyldiaminopimelate/putrescine aminotransferase
MQPATSMPRPRKRFLVQNGGNADIEVARARGNYVYDTRGRKYIDFIMGWCVGNFGWARPALRRRVHAFRGPDYIYPEYTYKPWRELAQLLVGLAPEGLTRCCRATGGSEAVELALQAAMLHTGRRKFVAIEDAYHGNTLGALSVGDGDDAVRVLSVARLKPPLDADALDRLETRLKHRDVAAVIMEPIAMNLGVLIPRRSSWKDSFRSATATARCSSWTKSQQGSDARASCSPASITTCSRT